MKTKTSLVDSVRAALGHVAKKSGPRRYLNLGPELNAVLGDPEKGVQFGKIIEIAGPPSSGKSVLCLDICASAQSDGAHIVWLDFENSLDQPKGPDDGAWPQRRGLRCHRGELLFSLIQPYIGKFKARKKPKRYGHAAADLQKLSDVRLANAEELIEEAEAIITRVHQDNPSQRIIVVTDSITAMLPDEQAAAGVAGQNMKTQSALAVLLSNMLRRWVAFLQVHTTLGLFVNQLRTKPGVPFGDPSYTPGGNAMTFYGHSRVRMYRVKGGRMKKAGKVIGVKGVIRNYKNKMGGVEGSECGYKIFYAGSSKFMSVEEVKGDE